MYRYSSTCLLCLLFIVSSITMVSAQTNVPPYFEQKTEPAALLASYYNAIARREYDRAYNYWSSAPMGQTRAQFAAGFAQTSQFEVYVRVPARAEGAAGNLYADVPTLIFAQSSNGTVQTYIGCFTLHKANVPVGDNPRPDPNWDIRSASLKQVNAAILTDLNTAACAENVGVSLYGTMDFTESPVDTLVSYFNAVVLRDYTRAYNYWITPPGNVSLQKFTEGYANTADVWVYLKLNGFRSWVSTAGLPQADVPVFLAGIHPDGVGEYFAGCYTFRRTGISPDGMETWRMDTYRIKAVAKLIIGMQEMVCPAR
jgi:hypothetical protein